MSKILKMIAFDHFVSHESKTAKKYFLKKKKAAAIWSGFWIYNV